MPFPPQPWKRRSLRGLSVVVVGGILSQVLSVFLLLVPAHDDSASFAWHDDFVHHHNKSTTPSTRTSNETAIFYNAYVPPPGVGNGPKNALRIIREQVQQYRDSPLRDSPLYYTLIGYNKIPKGQQNPFEGKNIHQSQYLPEGSEEETLQALYEYCVQHPNSRVSYIHDKGSFHRNLGNEIRRGYATKSALSSACQSMSGKCNVCMFDFNLLPHVHAGTNMWTAECNYVKNLHPPHDYNAKMMTMYESFHECDQTNHTWCTLRPPNGSTTELADNDLSIGRYAMEHWVMSHPDLRPCETLVGSYGKIASLEKWKPELRVPKRRFKPYGKFWEPWFTREGRLYEYQYIYQKQPPTNSWFWRSFSKHTMEHYYTAPKHNKTDGPYHYPNRKVVLVAGDELSSVFPPLVTRKKSGQLRDWTLVGPKSLTPALKSILFSVEQPFYQKVRYKIDSSLHQGRHVLLGADLWNIVGQLSPKQATAAFEGLYTLFSKQNLVNVTILYKTPRSSQLVSVWQQQQTKKEQSLAEWLCHDNVEKIVASQMNAMGVANAFVKYGNTSATIVDLSRVEASNVILCDLLGKPCNHDDSKPKNPPDHLTANGGLDSADVTEIESILRRMDCYYYCRLKTNLTVLHAKDDMFTGGWNKCCASPDGLLSPSAAYTALKNVGCRASKKKKKQ